MLFGVSGLLLLVVVLVLHTCCSKLHIIIIGCHLGNTDAIFVWKRTSSRHVYSEDIVEAQRLFGVSGLLLVIE